MHLHIFLLLLSEPALLFLHERDRNYRHKIDARTAYPFTHRCAYFNPLDSYLITFVAFLVDQRQAVSIRAKMHQALKLHLGKTKKTNRNQAYSSKLSVIFSIRTSF